MHKETEEFPAPILISEDVLLSVQNISMHFPTYGGVFRRQTGQIRAVDGVSFSIKRGRTLGLVGESGCGKSTIGRIIMRLYEPTAGKVFFDGIDFTGLKTRALRQVRPRMQMIFQDPHASLNPRMTVGSIIAEPLEEHGRMGRVARSNRVGELLESVGLSAELADRYPHEFSGGQRQRIGIARALALKPELIVCDEPIAALDVSIQAQVINLLKNMQRHLSLTYLFISHDLSMVRYFVDDVAVMYLGKLVELAPVETLYSNPRHPYTKALLSAIPVPDPKYEANRRRIVLRGDVSTPSNGLRGCRFSSRCPMAIGKCYKDEPKWSKIENGHYTACHLAV